MTTNQGLPFSPKAADDSSDLERKGNYRRLFAGEYADVHVIPACEKTKDFKGCIMPAFDFGIPYVDQAFRGSVSSPYQVEYETKRGKTHMPKLGFFAIQVPLYRFVPGTNESFPSPMIRHQLIGCDNLSKEDVFDPIDAVRRSIWNDKSIGEARRDALLKGVGKKTPSVIPNFSVRSLFFVKHTILDGDDKGKEEVCAMQMSAMGFQKFMEHARAPLLAGQQPLDPDYATLVYGNFTKPSGALEFSIVRRETDNDSISCWSGEFPEPMHGQPLEVNTWELSQEDLESRFLLHDPKNWNIPTTQELVDYLVGNCCAGEDIVYQHIVKCCEGHAEIKSPSNAPATSGKPSVGGVTIGAPAEGMVASTGLPPAQPAQPQAPAVTCAIETTGTYWVMVGGQAAQQMSGAQCIEVAHTPNTLIHDGTDWKTAVDLGIPAPPPEPPAVPAAPVTPPPPAPPAAPAASPATPATPAATANVQEPSAATSGSDIKERLSISDEVWNNIGAEDKETIEAIGRRSQDAALSPEDNTTVLQIVMKAST